MELHMYVFEAIRSFTLFDGGVLSAMQVSFFILKTTLESCNKVQ